MQLILDILNEEQAAPIRQKPFLTPSISRIVLVRRPDNRYDVSAPVLSELACFGFAELPIARVSPWAATDQLRANGIASRITICFLPEDEWREAHAKRDPWRDTVQTNGRRVVLDREDGNLMVWLPLQEMLALPELPIPVGRLTQSL